MDITVEKYHLEGEQRARRNSEDVRVADSSADGAKTSSPRYRGCSVGVEKGVHRARPAKQGAATQPTRAGCVAGVAGLSVQPQGSTSAAAVPSGDGAAKQAYPSQERGHCFILPILQRKLSGISHAFRVKADPRNTKNNRQICKQ
jgi:hypothetical protein